MEIRAEMTGVVRKTLVAPGQQVEEGTPVVILESMKMEIPVESPAAGRIEALHVEQGTQVEDGTALATLTE